MTIPTSVMRSILAVSLFIIAFYPSFGQLYTHPTQGLQNTFLGACMVNGCGGTYTDDGGLSGNYSNNINAVYRTFCPDVPGQCIRLTFTSFNLEPPVIILGCLFDVLTIGNGPTQNSPALWSGCGSTLPPVITSTDASGCITIRFTSNGSNNYAGWVANLSCVPCAGSGPSASLNTDCINAQYVCDNLQPINANSQGPGLVADACVSGCALSENYSNWYILNVTGAGTLGFTLTPTPNSADYDFSLYGPVMGGCANLGNPIRCSYAANVGPTGMRAASTDASEDVMGDGWVSMANVVVGTYYLLINQWAYEPNSSFRLDFSGTASIGLPAPQNVTSNSPVCSNEPLQLNAPSVSGAIYTWNGPGGWTSNQQNPSRNPPVAGDYSYFYTVNGCNSPAVTVSVAVNPAPTPSVNPSTADICTGDIITLDATGGIIYLWSNSENTSSITVSPVATTIYTVTVTNADGCSATASATVNLSGNLTVSISPPAADICSGESITLTASGGDSYIWSNSDAFESITVAPAITTTYSVTAANSSGCTGTASVTVDVNQSPVAAIDPATAEVCEGESATLTASGGIAYLWDNSENSSDIIATPSITTTYHVTVTDANGCTATVSRTVDVNENPTIAINPPTVAFCAGGSETLTASGGNIYIWNTSDPGESIFISPLTTTDYSVTALDGNGCSGTASVTVNVNQNAVAMIAPLIAEICDGESITLTASGGVSYAWDNAASTPAINVTPSSTSSYSVTVTDAGGCTATESRTVTVNATPSASITPPLTSICSGEDATLDAAGGVAYLWSNASSSQSITVSPSSNAVYSVTVYGANGCTASASADVNIFTNPDASITPPATSFCNGESAALSVGGGITWLWSTGENTQSVSISPASNTSYSVTVIDANTCSATASATVNVNANPVIMITPATIDICGGQSVTFEATGGVAYDWSNTLTGNQITVSPFVTTDYSATGADANGCTGTATATVNVIPSIILALSVTPVSCNGGNDGAISLTVSGGQPPYSFAWDNNANSQNISGLQAGTYAATITDNNGCGDIISADVAEPDALVLDFTLFHPTCPENMNDGSIVINVNGGTEPYQYDWSNGGSDPLLTALAPGNYSITVTDFNDCEIDNSFNLNYEYIFSVDAGEPIILQSGESSGLQFTTIGNVGTISNIAWEPSETLNCSACPEPVASPTLTTLYTVTVTNSAGCSASDTVRVTVYEPAVVHIPNAFSPNGDGINDELKIYGNLQGIDFFEMKIFNRWGEKIFQSNDPGYGWNGAYRGKIATEDTYIFVVRYSLINDPSIVMQKGSFMLMR